MVGEFGDKKPRKRADARVGHQTAFGDKEQGSVLMHAQVIKLRLVTKYNIKVINKFWKRGC